MTAKRHGVIDMNKDNGGVVWDRQEEKELQNEGFGWIAKWLPPGEIELLPESIVGQFGQLPPASNPSTEGKTLTEGGEKSAPAQATEPPEELQDQPFNEKKFVEFVEAAMQYNPIRWSLPMREDEEEVFATSEIDDTDTMPVEPIAKINIGAFGKIEHDEKRQVITDYWQDEESDYKYREIKVPDGPFNLYSGDSLIYAWNGHSGVWFGSERIRRERNR